MMLQFTFDFLCFLYMLQGFWKPYYCDLSELPTENSTLVSVYFGILSRIRALIQ